VSCNTKGGNNNGEIMAIEIDGAGCQYCQKKEKETAREIITLFYACVVVLCLWWSIIIIIIRSGVILL
jgi:hypothetical protein